MGKVSTGEMGLQESHRSGQVGDVVCGKEAEALLGRRKSAKTVLQSGIEQRKVDRFRLWLKP